MKNQTRITMVMAGNEEGGLEKHVVELSNGLAACGYALTVIAHAKYQQRLSPAIVFMPMDLSKSRRNPLLLWQLYQAIKKSEPDVLHVHANKAVAMVAPLLKWLNVASIASLHSHKKNTRMFQNFDAVIAVSEYAAESVLHPQIHVVYNGIRPPAFQAKLNNSNPVALAVGRLVPVKGFDLLIEAWPGLEAQLWIAGEGTEQEKLAAAINRLKQQDRIQLLGQRADVLSLMQQADLFVMSSHYEGCPYTMVEALLMRTPMVSTAVGAMKYILPPQYLCKPNDHAALHATLHKALLNPEQLRQDFEPVFNYAQQHLTLDSMLSNTVTVYQRTLQKHRNDR